MKLSLIYHLYHHHHHLKQVLLFPKIIIQVQLEKILQVLVLVQILFVIQKKKKFMVQYAKSNNQIINKETEKQKFNIGCSKKLIKSQ